MNKKILIGLGVLAVAGIGYYMWKNKTEKTSGACGCSAFDGEEEQSNVSAKSMPTKSAGKGKSWCCAEYNAMGKCTQWEKRNIGSPCGGAERVAKTPVYEKQSVRIFR